MNGERMKVWAVVGLAVVAVQGAWAQEIGTGPERHSVMPPTIKSVAALNGAKVVSLGDRSEGAEIYYTLDGSEPTNQAKGGSFRYDGPFLVASKEMVKAIAVSKEKGWSAVSSASFATEIPAGTLVWSDEFLNENKQNLEPNPAVWTYDTGDNGFGNRELETYCKWGESYGPCNAKNANAFVPGDGYLHVVARQGPDGKYTSGRLKTQGLVSFLYGRIEARMKLPEEQGMWPAFWMLGSSIARVDWPACGEIDIMEHVDAPKPDWVAGSLHGGEPGRPKGDTTQHYFGSGGFSGTDWHTYGVIWAPRSVKFYVDSPANVYASWTPADFKQGATWPFDSGPEFVLLNLAVGGNWPGSPDATTKFPEEMLVDWVRVYAN